MKTYEEFSASVFQRADARRRENRTRRRRVAGGACLGMAMLVAVATTTLHKHNDHAITAPSSENLKLANTQKADAQVLVMVESNETGERSFRVYNAEEAKVLLEQYQNAQNLPPDLSFGAKAAEATETIRSLEELAEYFRTASFSTSIEALKEEFDEAFFQKNTLQVHPVTRVQSTEVRPSTERNAHSAHEEERSEPTTELPQSSVPTTDPSMAESEPHSSEAATETPVPEEAAVFVLVPIPE